jgi:hypothetical protein
LDERVKELLLAETSWDSAEWNVKYILRQQPFASMSDLQESASQVQARRHPVYPVDELNHLA